jgi:hypothetical protein
VVLRCKQVVVDRIMPVPYSRTFKDSRKNRGFRDLRGRPDEAARVIEARDSRELQLFLEQAAEVNSRLFTIGCDLGMHMESRLRNSNIAGGYIQIALRDYTAAIADDYWREATVVLEAGRKLSRGHLWRATFLLGSCRFRLGTDPEAEAPSLLIYFWALSRTAEGALCSREAFIAFLRATLLGAMG